MTAAQGTPNRGKGGKSVNLIKFDQFFDFSPKWSWGPLDRLKILSWSPLRFSTIENSILRTFTFSSFLDQNRPLAHFSLGPLGQGHPGVQAKPEASLEPRKLNTSHAKCKSSFIFAIPDTGGSSYQGLPMDRSNIERKYGKIRKTGGFDKHMLNILAARAVYREFLISKSGSKMLLKLVASFPPSFSPIRATAIHFRQKFPTKNSPDVKKMSTETIFWFFGGYFERGRPT